MDKIAPFTKKAKLIITVHDMGWYRFGSISEKKGLIYKQIIETLKRSSAIIAVSEFTKDEIVKYLPFTQGKIHVIHNGVSTRFHPIDKKLTQVNSDKKYPWNDYILYIGLWAVKGHFLSFQ